MRKLFLILFLVPLLAQAHLNFEVKNASHNNYSLAVSHTSIEMLSHFSGPKSSKSGLPISFYPWGLAATAVLVGGSVAYYGGYKENLPLAVTGGTVALLGGALAVVSLSPLRKYVGLAYTSKKKNVSFALNPASVSLSCKF